MKPVPIPTDRTIHEGTVAACIVTTKGPVKDDE